MLENEMPVGPAVQAPPAPAARSGFWDSNPKTMFFMGLFLGLAVASTIGLGLVLGSLWTGKAFGATIAQNINAANPSVNTPPTDTNTAPPAQPVKAVDEKADHIIGSKSAKVTLIEYSDFQCPYCSKYEPTLKQALKDYPKDVRLVFRNFPLTSIHPYAEKAAEAAECVAKLAGNDAYWTMHDNLFTAAGKGDLTEDVLLASAKGIKSVDQAKLKSCIDSGEMKARVDADFASGNDSGVNGTPSTFVNGKIVSGAVPYTMLQPEITGAGGKN